ncbi:MAG: CotH kinase family protein [Ignavibacteria bacterium]|nr:CotH kinase family protein [Ignavibacteria bacterium]
MKNHNPSYFLFFSLLFCFFIQEKSSPQSLYINEIMASNAAVIADPDYKAYSDWIELFNASETQINLKDYSITDDLSSPYKYIFQTDLIIQPKNYLLVWADDKNIGAHANFKLSASGQQICLFNPLGELVDSITFSTQQTDISFGRFPDATSEWFKFSPSSPGSQNLFSSIYNKLGEPVVSHQSGFYAFPITLSITPSEFNSVIYYTTVGTAPTQKSSIFTGSIQIDSTSVLRIRSYKDGFLPSNILTYSYFINEQIKLPVFSIITDPVNFFSDSIGIYVAGINGIKALCSDGPKNWNQDWERPIELEFFEKDRSLAFKTSAGVKIYGGCSRIYPMKSLAFYFRPEYGMGTLNYRMFPNLLINEFENIVLRSGAQDWWRTMCREEIAQSLIEQGMKVDHQAYRPSILFINGQYWGIHNVREKLDDNYLAAHFGVDKDSVDLIQISKAGSANYGDIIAYNEMMTFLTNYNIAATANYEHIKSIVDIDEYIDYQIAEIFSANGDWPGSNMKLWRERSPKGKWRWMIYDLDFTFGGNANGQYFSNTLALATATDGPDWPNPPWATLMLRRLLENTEFRNEFIQRFAVHMNTTYEPVHVISVIDSLSGVIASEIPRHKQRWEKSITMGKDWFVNVQVMRDFAINRPDTMRKFISSKFSLAGTCSIKIGRNNTEWGKIFTHEVEVKNNDSQNVFFKNIPLKVRAFAMPGYRFVRWEGISDSTAPELIILPQNDSYLTAIFEPADLSVTSVVINEINYKSSPSLDTDDWVELYNPSTQSISLSGWKFHDGKMKVFLFPENVYLKEHSYFLLCRDTTKFKSFYQNEPNVLGDFQFGLSSSGDTIKLIDAGGNLVDEVSFSSTGEWDSLANGTGRTLSLHNPQLDNAIPQSWRASSLYGTPGKLNDIYTKTENETSILPDEFALYQNYPNPFNPSATIRYALPFDSKVVIKIYNTLGQEVALLKDEIISAGNYEVQFHSASLTSGVYFYRLSAESLDGNQKYSSIKKMILLK